MRATKFLCLVHVGYAAFSCKLMQQNIGHFEKFNERYDDIMSGLYGGLVIIKEKMSTLPDSERKAALYILENPREIIHLTVGELAEKSQTSKAAIIRMCRSLELKGFQDLRMRIAGDISATAGEKSRDIKPNEEADSIIQKMTVNSVLAVRNTATILDKDEIERAASSIGNAQRIHFFGIGSSLIIAKDAAQKFQRIKKNATAVADLHQIATLVATMEKDDVLFIVSFSGETKACLQAVNLGKEYGVKTISLTSCGSNSISRIAEVNLFVSPMKEAMLRSGATSSRIAMFHALDILFMIIATRDYEKIIQHIDETRVAISKLDY